MLSPKGWIAQEQKDLLLISTWLMLIIVIPVFVLAFYVVWKYREGNKKANYMPDWDQNMLVECIWWGLPFIIVTALSIITWISCVKLDPFKPLEHEKKPITIQVVALQWKWLFLYPEQGVASLGFVQFPEKTPVSFQITADAPMNSFWIPDLGGQIYAMAGMDSRLHLIADEVGNYRGCSANLSGDGFAYMTFTAKSCSEEDFHKWVESTKTSSHVLDINEYNRLVAPTINDPETSYVLTRPDLYNQVLMKFMMPDALLK
jgi:cytochrome o ubiquinol oxidase subunit 2